VNAQRSDGVADAAGGCDLLVNCVPAKFNCTVLRAALRFRSHYLDLASHLGRNPFKPEQLLFARQFIGTDRCAIINAGVAPGLSNLLAAEAAEQFDSIDSIRIRLFEGTESDQPVSTWSAEVAWDEAISRPRIYRDGRLSTHASLC
jgi:saccharopine dehydrogenase-like NADP-dependent oxidoreductase